MSKKLYIGQRARVVYVRVSWSDAWRPGAEVVVAGYASLTAQGNPADYLVTCADGGTAAPLADQLSPIIPEGAAPSELSYTELMDRLKAGEVECV